jgi:hypothetical protein
MRKTNFKTSGLLLMVLFAGLTMTACFESKIETTKLVDPDRNPYKNMQGVFYSLPRTIVRVEVAVVKTQTKEGLYKEFAPCFFPKETLQNNSTSFEMDPSTVKFDKLSVADPGEVYLIKTQGGKFETRNLEMALTESGVFVKGVAESENQSLDVLTSAIKDVVGIASKAIVGPAHLSEGVDAQKIQDFRAKLTPAQDACYGAALARREAAEADLDTLATSLGIALSPNAAIPIEKRQRDREAATRTAVTAMAAGAAKVAAQATLTELDTARQRVNDFEQAKVIYDRILELEEKRDGLLGGGGFNAPLPSDTFTKILGELDTTLKAYKDKYFLGTKKQTATTLAFRMDPPPPPVPPAVIPPKDLFNFSETNGICLPLLANNQGVKVDPDFGSTAACANPKKIRLVLRVGDNGEGDGGGTTMAGAIQTAGLNQNGRRGFYYRVPGRGVAELQSVDGAGAIDELGRETLSIAQFGNTVSLPSSTGGRRTKYTIDLFEASGGLKNFVMGSDALVKQQNVKDLTDSAATIFQAAGEKREERRKANLPPDELNELERKRKILEEKKKIQDLEKALGTQGSNPEPNDFK